MTWLTTILGWITSGPLDRVLSTVDKQIASQTDREAIKGRLVEEYIRTRPSWLQAGGLWTLLLFALPAAIWRGAVYIYSILWCSVCAYPQSWAIGDIPSQFKELDGWIVLASIGVIGLFMRR